MCFDCNKLQSKFRRGVKYALLKITPSTRRKSNPEQALFYGARRSPKGGYFMNPDEISGLIVSLGILLIKAWLI